MPSTETETTPAEPIPGDRVRYRGREYRIARLLPGGRADLVATVGGAVERVAGVHRGPGGYVPLTTDHAVITT
jgi:hypothetical protein